MSKLGVQCKSPSLQSTVFSVTRLHWVKCQIKRLKLRKRLEHWNFIDKLFTEIKISIMLDDFTIWTAIRLKGILLLITALVIILKIFWPLILCQIFFIDNLIYLRDSPLQEESLPSIFYSKGNRDCPRDTQLGSSRVKIWTQALWCQSLSSKPLVPLNNM